MNAPETLTNGGSGSHLVVKRGHHGRYRFAMMTSNGRLKGEVQIEVLAEDRTVAQARALAKISSVADEISAAIAIKIAAAEHPDQFRTHGDSAATHGLVKVESFISPVDNGDLKKEEPRGPV